MTAYTDRSGADVWVAQRDVRNMHMVASYLPASVAAAVDAVPGVAAATAILYSTDTISAGSERAVAYVIGLPASPTMGAPWELALGTGQPGPGEIVVDEAFARRAGVGIGDEVTVLGGAARISGLSRGTATLLNSVAFITIDDFRARRGGMPLISYVLVRASPGVSADDLSVAIEQRVPGVTAMSRSSFAASERRLATDMSADVIAIMNVIGFLVALAVVAFSVYVSVLARRRDYGVLKAIGAGPRVVYSTVVSQATLTVLGGLIAALALVVGLSYALAAFNAPLQLSVEASSVARAATVAGAVAAFSAVLPIRQIAALDPAIVFRRGATS